MALPEVLVGRYRLDGPVGRGGMAEVLRAQDLTLSRPVAVKVLHDRFADDEQFQARFRQEAQAAASLNHPNIVGVYDTGEEGGLPFFVMELVEGRSLQEVIQRGGLTEERALEVAADTCAALQYAHERNLVHRDVKPGNILLAEDGSVKVADFGIARAINADTVTQTAAVLGTAAYLSPEQAQGRPADVRSDLYALGVVLYELLTGEQPFQGESAVTVAYQHVQEQPAPPRELDPSLSEAAQAIVMRAMAKNPANRYQDAAAMRDDLLRARSGQPVAAPAVLPRNDTAAFEPVAAEVTEAAVLPGPRGGRAGRILGYLLLAALTFAAAGGAVWFLAEQFAPEAVATARVPRVVGESSEVANQILSEAGFEMRIVRSETSPDVPAGGVISQEPTAGASAPERSVVEVVLSLGEDVVAVPDVTGEQQDDARQILRSARLVPGSTTTEPSDDVEAGIVLRTSPEAGAEISPLTPIDLVVSGGREVVRVAGVVGFTEFDALSRLDEQGLEGQVLPVFSDTIPEGVVVRQDPPAGTELQVGDEVTLEVSRGPAEPVPSPEPSPDPTPTVSEQPDPTPDPTPEPTPTPTPTPEPTPAPEE